MFTRKSVAYGNRWVSQDQSEKPFEWITEVRCLSEYKLCILARNQKVLDGSQTKHRPISRLRHRCSHRLHKLRQLLGRQRNCSSMLEFPEDLVRPPLFSVYRHIQRAPRQWLRRR